MQDDLTDATRWAVEQGYADKKRIAIAGASYKHANIVESYRRILSFLDQHMKVAGDSANASEP